MHSLIFNNLSIKTPFTSKYHTVNNCMRSSSQAYYTQTVSGMNNMGPLGLDTEYRRSGRHTDFADKSVCINQNIVSWFELLIRRSNTVARLDNRTSCRAFLNNPKMFRSQLTCQLWWPTAFIESLRLFQHLALSNEPPASDTIYACVFTEKITVCCLQASSWGL